MKTIFSLAIAAALIMILIGPERNKQGSHQVVNQEMASADLIAASSGPTVIKKVQPVYPREALRAGLEGEVQVKILVDQEGKPEQVVILKSDSELFNEASIEAAKQFLFAPTYIRDKPISVWVAIPFKYRLDDKKGT